MENASKALIIAGAILISILLISIGIILINSGRDVTETGTAGMTSQAVQTFNAQFTPYEGVKKGSEIRAIKNVVKSSNGANPDHKVTLTETVKIDELQSTKEYKVTLTYNDDTGYITGITVANKS